MGNSAEVYRIRWSNKASLDHESIYLYIADILKEPETAGQMASLIYDKISDLVNFPSMYPIITSRLFRYSNIRKMPIEGYNVYYKIDEKQKVIKISRILHSLRDLKGLL